ncbi:Toxin HigB-2 [compost metagenome]
MFTFVEAAPFERLRAAYLDEDELADLQVFMMENPEAGDVIPGTGGLIFCGN